MREAAFVRPGVAGVVEKVLCKSFCRSDLAEGLRSTVVLLPG
jgi:hypothetical protein